VTLADALAKQLSSLANDIANSGVRSALLKEASDTREYAARLSALEATRPSFLANRQLFVWNFGISVPPISLSGSFGLKGGLQKIQDQVTRDLGISISDSTIVERFSRLFADLASTLDAKVSQVLSSQFNTTASTLDANFRKELETLVGKDVADSLRTSNAQAIIQSEEKFKIPDKDKLDPFKRNVSAMFDEYANAITRELSAQGGQNSNEEVRLKFVQSGSTLLKELRAESERVAASANVADRDRQSLSTYAFVGLTIAFVVVIGMLLCIPIFYSSEVQNLVFRSSFFLQLFTVYVLSSSIVILALGSFLDGNSLATLLAGISGYVLGQLGKDGSRGDIVVHPASSATVPTHPLNSPPAPSPTAPSPP
jgi:hypothetical protein